MTPSLGPGVTGLSVASRYIPTRGGLQVGGDWYDVIKLADDRAVLGAGDVEGHAMESSAVMGQVPTAVA
ncbi:hypothetical protein, partial [Methylobacterium frigidaeris]|uniref:hypothetical protein n=1 Tax=Methylobacterium frigidaeris TaxID=2038277 RepID=UPI001EDF2FF2